MNNENKIKLAVVGLIVVFTLVIGIVFGNYLGTLKSKAAYEALLTSYRVQHEHIETVNNKHRSTEQALIDLTDAHTDTLSLLAKLKATPAEVQYLTRTDTKLVPAEPIYVSSLLPREYTYKVGPLITGSFKADKEYTFTNYELNFRTTVLSTKKKTSVLVQANSSAEPGVYYDIPTTVSVTHPSEHKVLKPELALGITGGGPTWDLGGSLIMPWLHPVENLDLLSPRLTVSSKQARVGIDVASYNIGKPLPIVDDLWISLGGSSNLQAKPNLDVTISTKF